jgi:hypothetical protein
MSSNAATEESPSMIHVFSTQTSPYTERQAVGGTLSDERVQDGLLVRLSTDGHPKMKVILNHFASNTVRTFSPGTSSDAAWREALPLLATHHIYVLNGILAVGSLHLSMLTWNDSERDEYQDIAATQMNIGMVQYRTEVQNITTDNAEALFAYSTTITTFVLGTACTECRIALESLRRAEKSEKLCKEITSLLVTAICRIFRAIRGVLVILVPCYHHIRSGKLEPILERDWWPPPVPVTVEEREQDQRLRNLEKMWAQPGTTYEYCFDTLRRALKNLRESFALVSRLATSPFQSDEPKDETFDWTSIMGWPTELPLEFLSLLEQQRMEAWVLMAHFALLPAKVKLNPWLDGLATNIFMTSALVIGEDNWDWIAWPAAVLNINLKDVPTSDSTL